MIGKLCVARKEHSTFPVLGEQFLALAKSAFLAIAKLTVHCPIKTASTAPGTTTSARLNELTS